MHQDQEDLMEKMEKKGRWDRKDSQDLRGWWDRLESKDLQDQQVFLDFEDCQHREINEVRKGNQQESESGKIKAKRQWK